jgi:membrane fusion protein, heavy metal efflux system
MTKFFLAITISVALVAGCKNKTEEHGHEHGVEALAYTVYSDKSEVFVEFKPLIVGNTSKFAAHFTILGERFLPLSEGTVTISLLVGGKGIKQTADTPAVPGIYRLALKPIVAGTGKLVFDIKTKTFTDRIIIDSVKVYAMKRVHWPSSLKKAEVATLRT